MNYIIDTKPRTLFILASLFATTNYFGSEYHYNWAKAAFALVLLALGYYTLRSCQVILNGLKNEYNEQGNLPMLSIPYFLISVYYIWVFIFSFDDFFRENRESIMQALNIQDDATLFAFAADVALFSAIVAIGCNISKALFTLNALEFGNIHKVETSDFGVLYKSDVSKRFVFVEVALRLGIACCFVILELILSETIVIGSNNFFVNLGTVSIILFTLILIWFYFNKMRFKDNFIDEKWRKWSLRQYWSGIFVSILILFLGFYSNSKDFNIMIIGLLTIFIFSSSYLVLSIVVNEFPKNNNLIESEVNIEGNGHN